MPLVRTVLTMLLLVVMTLIFAAILIGASVLRIPNGDGSVYDVLPRFWSRAILWTAGVSVRVHGREHLPRDQASIFVCNHVSLFDILALVGWLPRNNFIAKAELFRIPVFGPGIRVLGTVPIERTNQKSAFSSYETAVTRIRGGSSVVVFPEGTRGRAYPIRPFKKGPFVLAIKAEAPVVPVVVYGTIEILPKGAWLIHSGVIDVYVLERVATAGMTYDDRDDLAQTVNDRMQHAMTRLTSTDQ